MIKSEFLIIFIFQTMCFAIDIGIESKNSEINLRQECFTYTDCFNCTLSNCLYQNQKCVQDRSIDRNNSLSVNDFFTNGLECGDPLKYCSYGYDLKEN